MILDGTTTVGYVNWCTTAAQHVHVHVAGLLVARGVANHVARVEVGGARTGVAI